MPISFFQEITTQTLQLSDADFIRQIEWSSTATSELKAAAKNGDVPGVAKLLKQQLSGSAQASTIVKLTGHSKWSKAAYTSGERKSVAEPRELSAFNQMLLCETLVGKLKTHEFFSAWRTLLTAAVHLSYQLELRALDETREHRLIVLAGELPWRVGHLFTVVKKSKRLRERGCQVLHELLAESTDTDGTPGAQLTEGFGWWLASLVRSTEWAKAFRVELWDDDSAVRVSEVVRKAIKMCHPDGRIALSDMPAADCVLMLRHAAKQTSFRQKSAVRSFVDNIVIKSGRNKNAFKGKPAGGRKPGFQSDWAEVACLRNKVANFSDSIAIRYDQDTPIIESTALGVPLFDGRWELTADVDGYPIPVSNDWSCVCWFCDKEADYLELQLEYDNIQIERQVLLSRQGHYAIFSDIISGAGNASVALKSQLKLANNVEGRHDVTTREVGLSLPDVKVRVFPLGLAQDRVMSTPGSCSVENGQLEWNQTGQGGLYSPVLIDWHPDRQADPCDWNRLTVTEARTVVPHAVAAGYRVRTGRQQLFLYRSLEQAASPRSVLGHHTPNETVLANFTNTGQVEPIVLIEP